MLEIIIGVVAGLFTGLGMGGGTVLIILLTTFMNMEQHLAQAINLIFFIPTSIASIITNLKQKNIDLKLAIIVSLTGIFGVILGATISQKIESNALRKYFAIFILVIAIYEIYDLYKEYKRERKNT